MHSLMAQWDSQRMHPSRKLTLVSTTRTMKVITLNILYSTQFSLEKNDQQEENNEQGEEAEEDEGKSKDEL